MNGEPTTGERVICPCCIYHYRRNGTFEARRFIGRLAVLIAAKSKTKEDYSHVKFQIYVSSVGNFWEVSERVLQRIESPSAVAGRDAFCEYLNDTPWVAKRKGINIYKTC